jgi:hypothetical protein
MILAYRDGSLQRVERDQPSPGRNLPFAAFANRRDAWALSFPGELIASGVSDIATSMEVVRQAFYGLVDERSVIIGSVL